MSEGAVKDIDPKQVDIDEIEVELVIIGRYAPELNNAALFLTKRGWPTTVLTDLSKAIEFIAEHRPDYVLVSLSHQSSAITRLPDLITQTFNLACIGFVETTDPTASARLHQMRLRYKLQGLPSGPNIHRTIRKILAERFNVAVETTERSKGVSSSTSTGSNIVKIEGSTRFTDDKAHIVAGNAKDGGGNVHFQSGPEGPKSLFSSKGSKKGEGAEDELHLETDSDEDASFSSTKKKVSLKELTGEGHDPASTSGDMLFGKTLEKSTGKNVTLPPSPDLVDKLKKSLFEDETENFADVEKAASGEISGAAGGQSSSDDVDNIVEFAKKSANVEYSDSSEGPGKAPNPNVEYSPEMKSQSSGADGGDDSGEAGGGEKDVFERAVFAAMSRYCKTVPGVLPIPLEEITYVGVFPVNSKRMPGYLVVVWQAPDLGAREAFLRGCEAEIQSAFESMNVDGELGSGFWTMLPAVDFVAWADDKAKFNFVTAHQKRTVGVAFFQSPGPLPDPAATEDGSGMYSISINQVSTEVPVSFKAHIKLPHTGRYFLYLRNGRQLQPEQKERLIKKHIEKLYTKSVELENLRQYLATSYLSGLIIEFKRAA